MMQNMQQQQSAKDMENMKTGTTTLGVVAENGVVLAADNRATMGHLKVSKQAQKVFKIDDTIGLTIAGSVGDAQKLVRVMRSQLKLYKLETKELSVKGTSTLLSNILHSSKMMPFMNQFIVGGIDDDGGVVYDLDPMGGLMPYREFTATGSGSTMAYGVLEDSYDESVDLEEATKIAVRALEAAMERDTASGDGMDIVQIDEDDGFTKLDDDEIEAHME